MSEKTIQAEFLSKGFSHAINTLIQTEKKKGGIGMCTVSPNEETKKDDIDIYFFNVSVNNVFTFLECIMEILIEKTKNDPLMEGKVKHISNMLKTVNTTDFSKVPPSSVN